jgi:hypothetical protein
MGVAVAVLQVALEIAAIILVIVDMIPEIVGMMPATVDVQVVQGRVVVAAVAQIKYSTFSIMTKFLTLILYL